MQLQHWIESRFGYEATRDDSDCQSTPGTDAPPCILRQLLVNEIAFFTFLVDYYKLVSNGRSTGFKLEGSEMTKKEIVLAALAPAKGSRHTPVQVQKLLFIIDKEIPALVNGPYFNFQPYNYGPFDKAVYDELIELASEGYVETIPENTWLSYRLTQTGQGEGDRLLGSLHADAQEYIGKASEFIRSLSFLQLVSAIYKAYPEMQVNSVFRGC